MRFSRLTLFLFLVPSLLLATSTGPSWRFWAWATRPNQPMMDPPFTPAPSVQLVADQAEGRETFSEFDPPDADTLTVELCQTIIDPCDWACEGCWVPQMEWVLDGGGCDSHVSTNWWLPLVQQHTWLLFTEGHYMVNSRKNMEGGLGFGVRRLLQCDVVLGYFLYGDIRHSELDHNYPQLSMGVEVLWGIVEARLTGNMGDSRGREFSRVGSGTAYLNGSHLLQVWSAGTGTERMMSGWDYDLGIHTPLRCYCPEWDLRLYGGGYVFGSHHAPSVQGGRFRTELEWLNCEDPCSWIRGTITLDGEITDDDRRGTHAYLGIRWRIPLASPVRSQRLDGLRHQMSKRIIRDWHI